MECLPQDLLDFPLLSPLLSPSSCAGAKQIDVRIQLCECVYVAHRRRSSQGSDEQAKSLPPHRLPVTQACLPACRFTRSGSR